MFLVGDSKRNPNLKFSYGDEADDDSDSGGSYEEIDEEWQTPNTQVRNYNAIFPLRTSSNFVRNQSMHRKRNFQKIFDIIFAENHQ